MKNNSCYNKGIVPLLMVGIIAGVVLLVVAGVYLVISGKPAEDKKEDKQPEVKQTKISIDGTSIPFATTKVGSTYVSDVKSIVKNIGEELLLISSIKISDEDGDQFVYTHDCPLAPETLATEASCSFSYKFVPTKAGDIKASIFITANILGGQAIIALSGKATNPSGILSGVILSSSSYTFPGTFMIGNSSSPYAVTVTNTSKADARLKTIKASGDFSVSHNCSFSTALKPGASCTLSIVFKPTGSGIRSGTVEVVDASGTTHKVKLTGTGKEAAPQLELSTESLSLGSIEVGKRISKTVIIKNTGNLDLIVKRIAKTTATDPAFTVSHDCPSSILIGKNCTLTVTYAPTADGVVTGKVEIDTNATESPAIVTLTGTGIKRTLTMSPGSLSFGSVTVGADSTKTVVLTNPGTLAVKITGISASGDFTVSETPATTCRGNFDPAVTCMVSVRFRPSIPGARTGSLTIESDSADSPQTVSLSGTGVPAAQPGTISFAPNSYTVAETGPSVTLTVSRTSGSDGTVTVAYTTSPGSANAGEDFQTKSGTLTFADGEVSKSITVNIVDNQLIEGAENFSVVLSNPTGGASLGTSIVASVQINDDDSVPS